MGFHGSGRTTASVDVVGCSASNVADAASCWIPGSSIPHTGLNHWVCNNFVPGCHIGHDPCGKPVKQSVTTNLTPIASLASTMSLPPLCASDSLRCSVHAGRAGALISSRPGGAPAPVPWWEPGFNHFPPLHSLLPDGILLLHPFSPGSSGNLPSGASFRKGYMAATFRTGPGMRPMPGLVWCMLLCSRLQPHLPLSL